MSSNYKNYDNIHTKSTNLPSINDIKIITKLVKKSLIFFVHKSPSVNLLLTFSRDAIFWRVSKNKTRKDRSFQLAPFQTFLYTCFGFVCLSRGTSANISLYKYPISLP